MTSSALSLSRLISIGILLICSLDFLHAQSDSHIDEVQYVSESWNIEDGLPVGHVNQIFQTPDGYVWMATFNGLVRFDGVRFTRFDVSNTPGLPSNRIILIQPGLNGSFWLFTEQRNVVHYKNGKFSAYGSLLSIENQRVILDGDSVTWITSEEGLLRFENDRLIPYPFGENPELEIIALVRRQDGTAIITDSKGVLYRTRYPYKLLIKISTPKTGRYPEQISSDPSGKYWITEDYLMDLEQDSIRILESMHGFLDEWNTQPPLYYALESDQFGDLFFLTGKGLYALQNQQVDQICKMPETIQTFEAAIRLGAGMCKAPDGSVWSVIDTSVFRNGKLEFTLEEPGNTIFFDREGSIWITNKESGVQRFSKAILSSYRYKDRSANYYGVYQDLSGLIWFGTWSREVFYKMGNKPIRQLRNSNELGTTAAFAEGLDGTFYIGFTRCSDADSTDKIPWDHFEKIDGLPNEIFAIRTTPDSSIWYGTLHGIFQLKNNEVRKIQDSDTIPDFPVRFILETPGKNLWLATNGSGVRHYNYANGRNEYFTKSDGLSSNNIRALFHDNVGNIWVATEDRGLNWINPKSGEIKSVGKKDGLYSESLNSILADDFGRIWFGANEGIFWVYLKDLQTFIEGENNRIVSTAYTERDGMLNRETNGGFQNSAMKSADGHLWFVTQNGLVSIDPSDITTSNPLPWVVIEDFSCDGNSIDYSGSSVSLERDAQKFRIKFTVPSFRAPNRIRFKYKLEGFDMDWVESHHAREAVYTNIPGGDYTFKVAAFYSTGEENLAHSSELVIVKDLKVRERPWFWICVALFLGLIVYGIFRWRLRQLHLKQDILESVVYERTKELEAEKQITESQKEKLLLLDHEKNRFFANISHEFRTPLTLIIGPLKDLLRKKETSDSGMRQDINTSLKNANRLMRLVQQLLDIAKLEAGKFSLDMKVAVLNSYVKDLTESFYGLADAKQIRFEVKIPGEDIFCRFDPEYLDKIILNLLSNAFKFTPEGGKIVLILNQSPRWVEVSVSDTGRGIDKANMERLFDRFYQIEKSELQPGTGIGLSIAKELAELHGGTIKVESVTGKGSVFTLTLPRAEKLPNETPVKVAAKRSKEALPDSEISISKSKPAPSIDKPDALPDEADHTSVLIVDDNADIRRYIARDLVNSYAVMEAGSGNEAFEVIRDHLPDVIISDVMMPDGDGLELLQRIRGDENYSFLPVILLTAKAEIRDKLEGLEIGADDYITKPFDMDELRARVRNILNSRKRLKAHYSTNPEPEILSKIQSEQIESESQEAVFIRRVTEVVQQNYTDEEFTVEIMANLLGQSRSNLYRKLRALTRESPSTMLRRIRLEHAAQLLTQNVGTVSEIAYASGFNSVAHFSRSFSTAYGMSPTAFGSK